VSAANLLPQIELVARKLGDLGDWQMLLDAGWYVQYGREDADLGNVDTAKFPDGISAVADAAHERGMDLILYLGTGFVHDSAANGGEWLALRGLIEKHPDWLIPFQTAASPVHRYLLDYENPDVQDYLSNIIRDFFLVHHADGILLDGIADAEGQLIPRTERDAAAGPPYPLLPTLDIYGLIRESTDRYDPDAFIGSGWLTPQAANPLVTTYFYGDDSEHVDESYPFPGLLEKVDYALFNRIAMNQRVSLGSLIGEPNRPEARWWIQASAALGLPGLLSFDMNLLDARTLADLRADLRGVDPSSGTTTFGPGLFPETFATTRDGVSYLGVVNRELGPRNVAVPLKTMGLDAPSYAALDANSGVGQRAEGEWSVAVPARSLRFFVLRPTPGLLRTSSVPTDRVEDPAAGVLAMRMSGPTEAPGFAQLVAPPNATVLLDGVPLTRSENGTSEANRYTYDDASGIFTVTYAHSFPRTIEVRW
jgi:hypothetical protein